MLPSQHYQLSGLQAVGDLIGQELSRGCGSDNGKEKERNISQESDFCGESPEAPRETNYFYLWDTASSQAWHLPQPTLS